MAAMVAGASPRGAAIAIGGVALAPCRFVRIGLPLLLIFYLTVVAAASGRADGLYVTEQLGVTRVGGELGHYFTGGFAAHIGLGAHVDGWALEGSLDLASLEGRGVFAGEQHEAETWGVGVRRMFPVSPWVRLYARGAFQGTKIGDDEWGDQLGAGYRGHAIDYGGGLMLAGEVPVLGFLFAPLFFTDLGPKVSAGAWVDVGERHLWLRKERASDLDGFTHTWLLGFSLGGRF